MQTGVRIDYKVLRAVNPEAARLAVLEYLDSYGHHVLPTTAPPSSPTLPSRGSAGHRPAEPDPPGAKTPLLVPRQVRGAGDPLVYHPAHPAAQPAPAHLTLRPPSSERRPSLRGLVRRPA